VVTLNTTLVVLLAYVAELPNIGFVMEFVVGLTRTNLGLSPGIRADRLYQWKKCL
jgi:hypothetical protein